MAYSYEELNKKSSKSATLGAPTGRGGHPRFYGILQEMSNLHDRKNTDYSAGGKQGPLGNFHRVASIKQLYPGFDWESAYGTAIDFMLKQFDAMMILRATKRKSVTGEPVQARLRDMAIYTVIAEIIEQEEQEAERMRYGFADGAAEAESPARK